MKNFSFWQKWLFAVGLLLAVFGLALAFFNQAPFFDFLFNNQINPVFWTDGQIAPETIRFQQWIYGVLGATIAGWGVTVAFLARHPFRNKERWAWNAIALGVTLWFITDTAISLYFRVYFNAAFNGVVFLAVVIPLALSRKYFVERKMT